MSATGQTPVLIKVHGTEKLDYENPDLREMVVQVVARGGGRRLSSTATLTILLVDVNDNIPVFEESSYTFKVINVFFCQSYPVARHSNLLLLLDWPGCRELEPWVTHFKTERNGRRQRSLRTTALRIARIRSRTVCSELLNWRFVCCRLRTRNLPGL